MSLFHRTKKSSRRHEAHVNFMAGTSWQIDDPLVKLRVAASSCFFGEPMYYHRDPGDQRPLRSRTACRLTDEQVRYLRDTLNAVDPREWRGLGPAELLERAIDDALAADPEATLAEAVRLRTEERFRTTPQVILVRAANHARVRGTGLVRTHARTIIARADEPAVGLAYQLWRFGKPVPNSLKKAWRDALERFGPLQIAKYRLENRTVKTVDVVNLVRPRSQAVDRLVRGELTVEDRTWEAIISARGASRETWMSALDVMGHMALLRNLRNLLDHGVEPGCFTDRLIAGAEKGKQLPFRYHSAYRAVLGGSAGTSGHRKGKGKGRGSAEASARTSARSNDSRDSRAVQTVTRAIETCLMTSLGNLPRFPGRVMSLCDNSGSAQGTTTSSMGRMGISTIANLTGILAGMRADEGYIGVFGDRLEIRRVMPEQSVFEQVDRAENMAKQIGMATENGIWLFWDRAIREAEHWDTVFVFSDMQAGHGGLYGSNHRDYAAYGWGPQGRYIDVARLIATYRREVNPSVHVFLVQVAGYQDTLVPEFYDHTYILGGWSDGLLRFAANMMASNAPGSGRSDSA